MNGAAAAARERHSIPSENEVDEDERQMIVEGDPGDEGPVAAVTSIEQSTLTSARQDGRGPSPPPLEGHHGAFRGGQRGAQWKVHWERESKSKIPRPN